MGGLGDDDGEDQEEGGLYGGFDDVGRFDGGFDKGHCAAAGGSEGHDPV